MMVDRAINTKGVGVGITITSPSGQHERVRSVRLDYPLSKNQAEYKALIIWMQWALDTGIDSLRVISDSQVVVGQVNHDYVVNSDNLKEYAEKVNLLASRFWHFTLEKVDRNSNETAKRLAKIASGETNNDLGSLVELLSTSEHIQPLQSAASYFPTWVDELVNYISLNILPDDKDKAR